MQRLIQLEMEISQKNTMKVGDWTVIKVSKPKPKLEANELLIIHDQLIEKYLTLELLENGKKFLLKIPKKLY